MVKNSPPFREAVDTAVQLADTLSESTVGFPVSGIIVSFGERPAPTFEEKAKMMPNSFKSLAENQEKIVEAIWAGKSKEEVSALDYPRVAKVFSNPSTKSLGGFVMGSAIQLVTASATPFPFFWVAMASPILFATAGIHFN